MDGVEDDQKNGHYSPSSSSTVQQRSQIFKILNIPEPEYVKVITENKGSAFLVLFVLNNVANSMLATGAFEIYLDDVLIFSKIATGRFPSVEDLQSALRQHGLFPA
eukprot:scaffold96_cov167-Ochromonas_danica.AAC.29